MNHGLRRKLDQVLQDAGELPLLAEIRKELDEFINLQIHGYEAYEGATRQLFEQFRAAYELAETAHQRCQSDIQGCVRSVESTLYSVQSAQERVLERYVEAAELELLIRDWRERLVEARSEFRKVEQHFELSIAQRSKLTTTIQDTKLGLLSAMLAHDADLKKGFGAVQKLLEELLSKNLANESFAEEQPTAGEPPEQQTAGDWPNEGGANQLAAIGEPSEGGLDLETRLAPSSQQQWIQK